MLEKPRSPFFCPPRHNWPRRGAPASAADDPIDGTGLHGSFSAYLHVPLSEDIVILKDATDKGKRMLGNSAILALIVLGFSIVVFGGRNPFQVLNSIVCPLFVQVVNVVFVPGLVVAGKFKKRLCDQYVCISSNVSVKPYLAIAANWMNKRFLNLPLLSPSVVELKSPIWIDADLVVHAWYRFAFHTSEFTTSDFKSRTA